MICIEASFFEPDLCFGIAGLLRFDGVGLVEWEPPGATILFCIRPPGFLGNPRRKVFGSVVAMDSHTSRPPEYCARITNLDGLDIGALVENRDEAI